MNKNKLIDTLSEETTFSKRDVLRVLDTFVGIVEKVLKKDEKLVITGFGTFWLSHRSARKGINPATKQKIDLPPVSVPKFKPSKALREVLKDVKSF